MLEDSIIKFKERIQDKLNEEILQLFSNYFMETKIPLGWFEAAEKALKAPETRKQGRKRAGRFPSRIKEFKSRRYKSKIF